MLEGKAEPVYQWGIYQDATTDERVAIRLSEIESVSTSDDHLVVVTKSKSVHLLDAVFTEIVSTLSSVDQAVIESALANRSIG